MKGIILAGGSGTRLYPVTLPVCKQLLPIYDKPMIYYPLSILMLAGIREILIISTPTDLSRFQAVLGDGNQFGLHIQYAAQDKPRGLADAFIVGEKFIDGKPVAMVLGDNIIYGHGFTKMLREARRSIEKDGGGHNFAYYVSDPHRFGIVEFDEAHNVLSIEEKPERPKSNYASIGLYMFDGQVSQVARQVKPSARGELEIPSVMNDYLKRGKFHVTLLGRGFAWFDAGTHDSLLEAGEFVMTIEKRTGFKIGCIEEVAYHMGFINAEALQALAEPLNKSGYGLYLNKVAAEPPLKP
ncbi:MAG: glucose-1-phosphate thymidylyltransferase RfbA [Candidatus Berkelbacteria bacterium]|nr:MAG: glucose-1-phosphate thymidylyltransferase RfbA [Candidatus Berkelbacteria bacterium]QQG51697.1 MAG: glucose-1-phosphate thymidylyltransferase RfbA [Candidatus Berkelbacteria bacterium]